jgi:hypothetical protein
MVRQVTLKLTADHQDSVLLLHPRLLVLGLKQDAPGALGDSQSASRNQSQVAAHGHGNHQSPRGINGNGQWHNGNCTWVMAAGQAAVSSGWAGIGANHNSLAI